MAETPLSEISESLEHRYDFQRRHQDGSANINQEIVNNDTDESVEPVFTSSETKAELSEVF